jgi:serine/threonine protein kinase
VVTEPVEGESLSVTLWSHGSLQVRELIQIVLPLCDALEYLHRSNVVHGNVKPENIYLSGGLKAFNPKLLDYGLALFRGTNSIAAAQGGLADPRYLAPECLVGQPPTPRSDLYSLGVLMYEALSGFPPFAGASAEEIVAKQASAPPPPLLVGCEGLARIISSCLSCDPRKRYASAAELKAELAIELDLQTKPAVLSTPAIIAPEQEGDVLGNYQLIKLLGEGAMGLVFSARHLKLDRRVALKVLRQEKARDRLLVERFFHEARTANRISQENIVEIFDFVEEPLGNGDRRVYFAMELLEGVSLGELLGRGPVPLQQTISIVRQVCAALEAAHQAGVVHRDVKPDNIFLIDRGEQSDFVKVLDFGMAKLIAGRGEFPVYKTIKGAVVGTPAYMAPEQAAGVQADYRADIYAVGNILYRALSGRLPFQGESYGELLVNIVGHPVPALHRITPSGETIPAALQHLVLSCLSKDPSRRPQSMASLRDLLEPFERPRAKLGQTPPPPRQMLRASWTLDWLLAAALAVTVGMHC